MELLVATWVLRIAVVAALAVGGASYQAGTPLVDCVDRALLVAVAFTFAGRWLIGWLEPPERRLVRMRKKREAQAKRAALQKDNQKPSTKPHAPATGRGQ